MRRGIEIITLLARRSVHGLGCTSRWSQHAARRTFGRPFTCDDGQDRSGPAVGWPPPLSMTRPRTSTTRSRLRRARRGRVLPAVRRPTMTGWRRSVSSARRGSASTGWTSYPAPSPALPPPAPGGVGDACRIAATMRSIQFSVGTPPQFGDHDAQSTVGTQVAPIVRREIEPRTAPTAATANAASC